LTHDLLLDSLSLYTVEGALDPIYEWGVFVWFLSVYSSDFNSVEFMWSKVKVILRKLKRDRMKICKKL
jgi:transposase